jgi:hypothetical protein
VSTQIGGYLSVSRSCLVMEQAPYVPCHFVPVFRSKAFKVTETRKWAGYLPKPGLTKAYEEFFELHGVHGMSATRLRNAD